MITRTKCDVVPVWMFRELEAGAKITLRREKEKIYHEREEQKKKIQIDKETITWQEVKGKEISDCFEYDEWSKFKLKKDIRESIDKKYKKIEQKFSDETGKKIRELEDRYEKWKMDILTGKIPRSRIKEFEI